MTTSVGIPNAGTKRDIKRVLVPIVLVLLGLAVLIYPVVATQWNNVQQQRVAEEYAELEKDANPEKLNTSLEAAREYNKQPFAGPILDPWLDKIPENSPEYRSYLEQLDEFDTMARLVVPAGEINLPVYYGTDDDTLQNGVGHLFGSHLPVGGIGTHTVLTGHTGLPNATLFDNLKDVAEGDAIYVQVAGEKLKYEVDQIKVVLPDETEDLQPQNGQDLITLITCTPYGINSHRLLVRGHRVELDSDDLAVIEEARGAQWQWWMWMLIAGAVVVALALLWWVLRQFKQWRDHNTPPRRHSLTATHNRIKGEDDD